MIPEDEVRGGYATLVTACRSLSNFGLAAAAAEVLADVVDIEEEERTAVIER